MKLPHGAIKKLADASGIPAQRICDYMAGRLVTPISAAAALARASGEILKAPVSVHDWIFPEKALNLMIRGYYVYRNSNRRRPRGN